MVSLLGVATSAQDLSNFKGLRSGGDVPSDFTQLSSEKFREDFESNNNKELDKDFFLTTRFYIDELLLSGLILFNEPCSDYVNKVAKYVLRTEKELQQELRFYVLKSTVPNAFSTDQGIILMTTGLIATLDNEAQLAFIIGHEVSHYIAKHVRDSYVEEKQNAANKGDYRRMNYDERVSRLSQYSQDNELEADKGGMEYFLKSEYSLDEIFNVFEVLLYSDLPFDDIKFDSTFFNTPQLMVPGSYFPDTVNDVSIEEDYDDEGDTHPNVETRINKAADFLEGKDSRGKLKFSVSEEEFYKVRNLCRFEHVSMLLSGRQYGEALYSLFLLQRNFPDNRFLELSKMKALYGLAKYKNYNRYFDVAMKPSKVEGESFVLHLFLRELEADQLNVMAYRYVADFHKKYNDKTSKKYLEDMKKELAVNSKFNFKELKNQSYEEYSTVVTDTANDFDIEDSIAKIDASDMSKYDKIKLKKKLRALGEDRGGIDMEEDFHLFALHDLVANEGLIEELSRIKDDEESKASETLTRTERKKVKRKGQALGIDKVVVVDPIFGNYSVKGEEKQVKSEKNKLQLSKSYSKDYRRLDMQTQLVDSKNLNSGDVSRYNNIGLLFRWVDEIFEHDGIQMISSLSDQMEELNASYGTSHYLFSGITAYKDRHSFEVWHLYTIMAVYTAPIALIDLIFIHNYFDIVAYSVNSETDEIEFSQEQNVNLRARSIVVETFIYDVLHQLSADPRTVKTDE